MSISLHQHVWCFLAALFPSPSPSISFSRTGRRSLAGCHLRSTSFGRRAIEYIRADMLRVIRAWDAFLSRKDILSLHTCLEHCAGPQVSFSHRRLRMRGRKLVSYFSQRCQHMTLVLNALQHKVIIRLAIRTAPHRGEKVCIPARALMCGRCL